MLMLQSQTENILAEWPDNESPDFSLRVFLMAWLEHLHLPGARFEECDLRRSLITHCQLDKSIFRNSILRGCAIRHCSLIEADFTGADLSGCNFSGSNLSGAKLDNCNFRGATYDNSTIWPNEFLPPDPETHNTDVVIKGMKDRAKTKT